MNERAGESVPRDSTLRLVWAVAMSWLLWVGANTVGFLEGFAFGRSLALAVGGDVGGDIWNAVHRGRSSGKMSPLKPDERASLPRQRGFNVFANATKTRRGRERDMSPLGTSLLEMSPLRTLETGSLGSASGDSGPAG